MEVWDFFFAKYPEMLTRLVQRATSLNEVTIVEGICNGEILNDFKTGEFNI